MQGAHSTVTGGAPVDLSHPRLGAVFGGEGLEMLSTATRRARHLLSTRIASYSYPSSRLIPF